MKINQLTVYKSDNKILDNLNASFEKGAIHIIMGPNGSGKSTLSYAIAGHPDCHIESGNIEYNGQLILEQSIEERALHGIYLAPQYPPVIEGLSHALLFKELVNLRQYKKGLEPVDDFQFLKLLKSKAQEYSFDPKSYIKQSLNSGFSGGEKKRNEILQISLLEPDFILLDEIDSGLDIEAMKKIADFIVSYKQPDRTIVVVTHYPQFAQLIQADKVHILKNGQIKATGDSSLIEQVVQHGFGGF